MLFRRLSKEALKTDRQATRIPECWCSRAANEAQTHAVFVSAVKDAAIRCAHAREQNLNRARAGIRDVSQQAAQVTQITEGKDGRSEQTERAASGSAGIYSADAGKTDSRETKTCWWRTCRSVTRQQGPQTGPESHTSAQTLALAGRLGLVAPPEAEEALLPPASLRLPALPVCRRRLGGHGARVERATLSPDLLTRVRPGEPSSVPPVPPVPPQLHQRQVVMWSQAAVGGPADTGFHRCHTHTHTPTLSPASLVLNWWR